MNDIEQRIKAKIEAVGTPLKDWDINLYRGILTGYNEAFIIDGKKKDELVAEDAKSAEIIRPILRGRDIKRYGYDFDNRYLIATFPSRNYNIEDYPVVKKFLEGFKPKLKQTGERLTDKEIEQVLTHAKACGIQAKESDLKISRKKTNNKWFETQDSISYWDDFSKQKIVWARLMRVSKSEDLTFPRFSLVPEDFFTVDSLCFITGNSLDYLVHLLNSKIAAYYFFSNIAILDNGGMQMRQQYVENFPIPASTTFWKKKEDIDDIIFSLYKFNNEEIIFINQFLKEKFEEIKLG